MPPSERMRILSHRDTTLAMFMAQDMAQQIGIRPIKISALATAVSELTTNVIKYANNFTFATVRGAGHMVPETRPEAALTMLKNHIFGAGEW